MSTSVQIRAAWAAGVWANTTITALTDKIHNFDVTQEADSQKQTDLLYYQTKVNCFTYESARSRKRLAIVGGTNAGVEYTHTMQVFYYLEKDPAQTDYNYNTCVDRLETVDGIVISGLGKTWTSTVDFYEMIRIDTPRLLKLDGRDVWRAGYTYQAQDYS